MKKLIITKKTEEHLRAHPEISGILPEIMNNLTFPEDGSFLRTEVEMGRIIGKSGRVETPQVQKNEKILFAQRIGRNKPSRVVLGQGEDTSKVSLLAFPDRSGGDYVLITAWVGTLAPREPWDCQKPKELKESIEFWCRNALVYNPEVMEEPFKSSWEEILS